jgi:hypothetical protein
MLLGLCLVGGPLLLGQQVITRVSPTPPSAVAQPNTAQPADRARPAPDTGQQDAAGAPVHSGERRIAVGCRQVPGDPGFCDRYGRDLISRAPLSDRQRADLEPARNRLATWFQRDRPTGARPTPRQSTAQDDSAQDPAMPKPAEPAWQPDDVRAALVAAGFDHPQYRIARDDDPAPHRSVLYGVRSGTGCLIGWLPTVTRADDGSSPSVVGLLRSGTCLQP